MCLIVFAWQLVPGMPLVAAANRDESFDRPTLPAAWWDDSPDVFAGRDVKAGGTWMGVTRSGRFAAITNLRAADEKRQDALSRGLLVADYLRGEASPQEYVDGIATRADSYNGFNLLAGTADQLVWYSNRSEHALNGQPLPRGLYGLSNGALDAPWPKVVRTKAQFASLLCQGAPDDAFFEMLTDTTRASDCRLPCTGVSIERERVLSAVYIDTGDYGTRCSTLVRLSADGSASLQERQIR